ncbi:NAD(P)/FAD-dependent oxidoreductase [Salinispira pacifica]
MKKTTYLLIGGGVSSARAVESIRQLDRSGSITLVSRERELPYDRPPLSKELLRGEIRARDIRCKPRRYYWRNRVRFYAGRSVERLDPGGSARVAYLSDGTEIAFEKCLIATGAEPVRLAAPGSDLSGIHTLRTLRDLRALRADIDAAIAGGRTGTPVVIIGAGFIGMEAAASLTSLGLSVTVVEREEQAWPGFADRATADRIAEYLRDRGVSFRFGETVTAFGGAPREKAGTGAMAVSTVTTSSGELPCAFVCLAVGVTPNVALGEAAGLAVDDGIVVDETMRARFTDGRPAEGVYAAGDIARYPDPYFGESRRVEHYGQAEYTGLLAGMNMTGANRPYDLLTYVWSDLFDLHIEFAGSSAAAEKVLVRGSLEEHRFVSLYLSKGRLLAFLAVNWQEAEFGPLRFMIQQRTDLSEREGTLLDVEHPLAVLLG